MGSDEIDNASKTGTDEETIDNMSECTDILGESSESEFCLEDWESSDEDSSEGEYLSDNLLEDEEEDEEEKEPHSITKKMKIGDCTFVCSIAPLKETKESEEKDEDDENVDKEINMTLSRKRKEIEDYELQRNPMKLKIRDRILLLDIDNPTKASILGKIGSRSWGDEAAKINAWAESLLQIPFNTYRHLPVNRHSSQEDISDFLMGVKGKLDSVVYGMDSAKREILSFVAKRISNPDSRGTILALKGPKGTAKCLSPDTRVMMADGRYKRALEIAVGDKVMGDDSRERTVLDTAEGLDYMYTICGKYAEPYTVNKEHILVLKHVITRRIVEIPVKEYITKSASFRAMHKGFHVRTDFPRPKRFTVDCYFAGLKYKGGPVPESILYNTHEGRLDFLRGALRKNKNSHLGVYKRRITTTDIAGMKFLIRSLGFTVTKVEDDVVVFVCRTLLDPITIVYRGMGRYCGFCLDGNERFLLHDCTVSHNTRIVRKGMAEALGLPFASINFGGLKDSSVLIGHDMTYVSSTYGRIVQILIKTGCMNPIIYLDEIDKISSMEKATEVFGVLTHMLDEEQNNKFEDMYFKGIKIDLSKVLFVISFNHIENVDYIAADRMRIVEIDSPTVSDKVNIVRDIMLPEIMASNIASFPVKCSDDVLRHVIHKSNAEDGMRAIRENLKKIIEAVSLSYYLRGEYLRSTYEDIIRCISSGTPFEISKDLVDDVIPKRRVVDQAIEHMYI